MSKPTTYYELWTFRTGKKDPEKEVFSTAREALTRGRDLLFPEDGPVVEYQVFEISRRCIRSEAADA